jgi:hypothetical protein
MRADRRGHLGEVPECGRSVPAKLCWLSRAAATVLDLVPPEWASAVLAVARDPRGLRFAIDMDPDRTVAISLDFLTPECAQNARPQSAADHSMPLLG